MAGKTVVFNLSVEIARRFNRQRLTRMRRAFSLNDADIFQETINLPADDGDANTNTNVTPSKTFANFVSVYAEGTNMTVAVTIDGNTLTVPLTGFLFLPGAGTFVITNNSTSQSVETRILYS